MNIKEFFLGTQAERDALTRKTGRRRDQQRRDRIVTRGYFLRLGVTGGILAATTPLWFPHLLRSSESPLPKLAQEIRDWTLTDGTRMAGQFPEAEKAASVLAGEGDMRVWLPHVNSRLRFADNIHDDASLDTWREEDRFTETQVQVIVPPSVQFPNGVDLNYQWFDKENSYMTLTIAPQIRGSSVRLPVAIKEASQVYDHLEYSKLYLKLVEKQGVVSFRVIVPEGLHMEEEEKTANLAFAVGYTERVLSRESRSFYDHIIDSGSHIRVGGIMFANWYQDQLYRGVTPPETKTIRAGKNWTGFLEEKGVIGRQNNYYGWTQGSAPPTNSPQFLELVQELTGRVGPRFS